MFAGDHVELSDHGKTSPPGRDRRPSWSELTGRWIPSPRTHFSDAGEGSGVAPLDSCINDTKTSQGIIVGEL